MSTVFDVEKMSCENCAKHVTKAVQGVEPGAQVQVELSRGKVKQARPWRKQRPTAESRR